MPNEVLNDKRPVCPECKSGTVIFRITTGKFLCRRCGNEWEKQGKAPQAARA